MLPPASVAVTRKYASCVVGPVTVQSKELWIAPALLGTAAWQTAGGGPLTWAICSHGPPGPVRDTSIDVDVMFPTSAVGTHRILDDSPTKIVCPPTLGSILTVDAG